MVGGTDSGALAELVRERERLRKRLALGSGSK
jgi:hypothetical protein